MDLLTTAPQFRGKSILVNGTIYDVDEKGIIHDMIEADAQKLLLGRAWAEYNPEAMEERERLKIEAREAFKGRKTGSLLINSRGEVIDPTKMVPEKIPTAEDLPPMKAEPPPPTIPESEPESVMPRPPPIEDSQPVVEAEDESEVIPEEGSNDWPDPKVTMRKDYLMAMADAYDVQYPTNVTRQKLVDLITDAMYGQP